MPFSIFDIHDERLFLKKAIQIFNYQVQNVDIYRKFVNQLGIQPTTVSSLEEIPFLPIEIFKTNQVISQAIKPQLAFASSGTTGTNTSKHYVADLSLYQQSFLSGFQRFFGNVKDFTLLALLPSYLEKGDSSLVYMMKKLMEASGDSNNGFYLNNTKELFDVLTKNEAKKKKTILLGVTYALLDFAEEFACPLENTIVVETGGMKGRKKEMIRAEVHDILKQAFGIDRVYSEYGMTELLSQAWSMGDGIFYTPPWMKILIRDTNDPKHFLKNNKTGAINIIDLANYYSCSFLATSDLGRKKENGFEILGRFDHSDTRGCSLLAV